MKTVFILMVMMLAVSCGNKAPNSFKVAVSSITKVWTSTDGQSLQIDARNVSDIVITGLVVNGNVSDCSFAKVPFEEMASEYSNSVARYGVKSMFLYLNWGDPAVCSVLEGDVSFDVIENDATNEEFLILKNDNIILNFKV